MLGVTLLWNDGDVETVFRTEEGARHAAERRHRGASVHWHPIIGARTEPRGVRGDEYLCLTVNGACEPTGYSIDGRNWA